MDLDSLTLPAAPAAPRRQPVPVLAAVVPMAAGVVLWLITGSIFSLCFAALGPLMIGASILDGLRTRRRDRRSNAEEYEAGWRRAEQDLRRRHQRERRQLRRENPDAAAHIAEPPLRDLRPIDESTPIVIGAGIRRSALRVSGDDSDRSRAFRERAEQLPGAPIVMPIGRGICIRGPRPVAEAVARAILVQLCLRHSSAQLALVGDGCDSLGIDGFPHAGRMRRGAWPLAVVMEDQDAPDAAAQMRVCGSDGDIPEGISTVIDVTEPLHARVRSLDGVEEVAVECLSRPQAIALADAAGAREGETAHLPDVVALAELSSPLIADGLAAAIGRTETDDVVIDLVEDGPHAIVTGMTGSGKSELLVTWIASIARDHGPQEVAFVLADFKGGTAFDPLRDLPHVTAVMTDLDDEGARRGVQSLTAELRRRESQLAACGARSIAETRGSLARLVIVVDEFAALLQEHPDLAGVFTDIAARGRALGMHLILGTQRASGVIRDALAANCPLRITLRVTDAADSRLVIGAEDAAQLPGGAESRGLAFVRRPQDSEPALARVGLTGAGDLRAVGVRWAGEQRPQSPWLPPLATRVDLGTLKDRARTQDGLILGLADEPQQQRQSPVVLRPGVDRGLAVIGGAGSGRTSVLRALASQAGRVIALSAVPEKAWDAVEELSSHIGDPPDLIVIDDLDQLTASFSAEYASVFLERLEQVVRSSGARRCPVVITSSRVTGQLARVLEALPQRMLLRTGSKMEHLAAGGDNDGFHRDRPAGRGRIDDREIQVAWVEPESAGATVQGGGTPAWVPGGGLVGVISPAARRTAEQLRAAFPDYEVTVLTERPMDAIGPVLTPGSRSILVGDPEGWQRQWSMWQRVRSEGEMLVAVECAGELRSMAGCRELPPYAATHSGRAWSVREGGRPARVLLPAPQS